MATTSFFIAPTKKFAKLGRLFVDSIYKTGIMRYTAYQ